VLLPAPYYLNHEGAVRITGGVPVEVPLDPAAGFQLTLEAVAPFLDPAARARRRDAQQSDRGGLRPG
jgi:aspartate/methionine/tyrosine aminotransferase